MLTCKSIEILADKMLELKMFSQGKVIVDCGSSYGSLLLSIINVIKFRDATLHVKAVGLEYATPRVVLGLFCMKQIVKIIRTMDSTPLVNLDCNNKVQDLFHMSRFSDATTHVIAFDKAFDGCLCLHIVLLALNSRNVKYFITVKGHFSKGKNKCMLGNSSATFDYDALLKAMDFKLVMTLPSLKMNGAELSGLFRIYTIPVHLRAMVTKHYIEHLFYSFFTPLGFGTQAQELIKEKWAEAAKNKKGSHDDILSSVPFPEGPPDADPKSSFVEGLYEYYCVNADFDKIRSPRLRQQLKQQLKSTCVVSNEYICIGYSDMSCMSCTTRFPSEDRSSALCEKRPTNIKALGHGLFAKKMIPVGACICENSGRRFIPNPNPNPNTNTNPNPNTNIYIMHLWTCLS
jgi:hypothetical protein